MVPKPPKSTSFWHECDSCSCLLTGKNLETHTHCPPLLDLWDHSFILDQTLYSSVEDLDPKCPPPHLTREVVEKVVLLPQSVMQLCNFVIGQPVKLTFSNGFILRKAWPTSEGSQSTVRLILQDVEFELGTLPSKQVKVYKLESKAWPASEITYRLLDADPPQNLAALCQILLYRTHDRLLYPGLKLKIPFYGLFLTVLVTGAKAATDLTSSFDRLGLEDCLWSTMDSTTWRMETEKEVREDPAPVVVGGYKSILKDLSDHIEMTLNGASSQSKGAASLGVLLYGIHGTGKTLIANYLAGKSSARVFQIQGMEVYSKYFGETETRLKKSFTEAAEASPSIIVLDNVEVLCPRKGTDQDRRVVATVFSLFDSIRDKQVVVLATSSKPDDMEPALRRPGRLELEIEVPVPTVEDRYDILSSLVADSSLSNCLQSLAVAAHGFVGADLASVVSKAAFKASQNGRQTISEEELIWAQGQVKPSAMREVYVQVPNVKWSDIGGQEELKLKLQQAVEWPLKYPESFKRLGIKAPKGVLLYGPPGCSKTLVAKALATESQLNFLSVKGSDIFSKWVGESERAMRDLFKRARSVAPAIVFLDEVDALGSERDAGSTGGSAVQERVLSQLLTELDGVQPLDSVIIIAATNRPDRIDKALLRPGRLDQLIYVPLPSARTRREIFNLRLRKMPVDDTVDAEVLTKRTEGYSGAETVAVCNEAALKALEEDLETEHLSMRHFLAALSSVTPRTPASLIELYELISPKT